jgi:hypothetical protein
VTEFNSLPEIRPWVVCALTAVLNRVRPSSTLQRNSKITPP